MGIIKIFEDFEKPLYQNELWVKRMRRKSKEASDIAITSHEDYDELNIIKLYQEIVEIPYDPEKYLQQDSWYDGAKRIFNETLDDILKNQIISFEQMHKSIHDRSHDLLSV